jgi:hypothetical protein
MGKMSSLDGAEEVDCDMLLYSGKVFHLRNAHKNVARHSVSLRYAYHFRYLSCHAGHCRVCSHCPHCPHYVTTIIVLIMCPPSLCSSADANAHSHMRES